MEISSIGTITKPLQPHIYVSPTSSSGSGLATSMATSSTYPAQNLAVTIVSGYARITVPVTGVYHISFNTICDTGTGRVDASIRVNGALVVASLSQNSGSTGYRYRGMSIAVKLQANDYIQFKNDDWYNHTATGLSLIHI